MEPEFIGVVGGLGGLGAFLVRTLTAAGYQVRIADIKEGSTSWPAIAQCEVIFLAVPIPAIDEVLSHLGPLTRPDGVVIDVCSLKEAQVKAMEQCCRGEVIGSHPLCGPSAGSLQDQVVFVCPGSGRRWLAWFKSFLTNQGAALVEIDPHEHDQLMARVQVLRHLLLFSFGLSLVRLDFDLENYLPISGPWFSKLVDLLGVQLRQSPELYADLALHNPAAEPVWKEFVRAAAEVSDIMASGNRQEMINLFNQVDVHRQKGERGRLALP